MIKKYPGVFIAMLQFMVGIALINWRVGLPHDAGAYYYYFNVHSAMHVSHWLPGLPVIGWLFSHVLFWLSKYIAYKVSVLVMSALATVFLFRFVRWLLDTRTAVFAALLFAFNPLVVRWSATIHGDVAALALAIPAYHCLLRYWREKALRDAVGFALLSSLAAFVRAEYALLGIFQAALLLGVCSEWSVKKILMFLASCVGWAGFAAWRLIMQPPESGNYLGELLRSVVEGSGFYRSAIQYLAFVLWVLTPVVALMAGLGIWRSRKRLDRDAWGLVIVFSAVYGALITVHWAWSARFLIPLLPFALMFAGVGLASLRRWRLWLSVSMASTVVMLVVTVWATWGYYRSAVGVMEDMKAAGIEEAGVVRQDYSVELALLSGIKPRLYEVPHLTEQGLHIALLGDCERVETLERMIRFSYPDVERVFEHESVVRPILGDDSFVDTRAKSAFIGSTPPNDYAYSRDVWRYLFRPVRLKSCVLRLDSYPQWFGELTAEQQRSMLDRMRQPPRQLVSGD